MYKQNKIEIKRINLQIYNNNVLGTQGEEAKRCLLTRGGERIGVVGGLPRGERGDGRRGRPSLSIRTIFDGGVEVGKGGRGVSGRGRGGGAGASCTGVLMAGRAVVAAGDVTLGFLAGGVTGGAGAGAAWSGRSDGCGLRGRGS